MVMKTVKYLTNLVFPPKCIFCNKLIETKSGVEICEPCFELIPFIDGAEIMPFAVDGKFMDKKLNFCDGIICICSYSGIIRKAVIKYKFNNRPGFSRVFAMLISDKLKKMTACQKFDIIISVPLYKQRENARGYNQSLLISKILSRELGLPEKSKVLSRIRSTSTQSLLKREDRRSNVSDAFKVNDPNEIYNKAILLIDDIMTTGITLNECSKVLKEAGARSVVAAVIASGRKF